MPIYAVKTAISDATMGTDELIKAIEIGGVALQEILASKLVEEGQMIRRERTFEGVEVNYITLNQEGAEEFGVANREIEHIAIFDKMTEIFLIRPGLIICRFFPKYLIL